MNSLSCKFLLLVVSLFFTSVDGFTAPRKPASVEKEYIFPGTGFFVKNRDPYPDKEAQQWFIDANRLQKEGKLVKPSTFTRSFPKGVLMHP